MKFKVIQGEHTQNNAQGVSTVYATGEVCESAKNLAASDPQKFEQVDDNVTVSKGKPAKK